MLVLWTQKISRPAYIEFAVVVSTFNDNRTLLYRTRVPFIAPFFVYICLEDLCANVWLSSWCVILHDCMIMEYLVW